MYNTMTSDARSEVAEREMPKSMPQIANETGDYLKITLEKTYGIIKVMYGDDFKLPDGDKPETLEDKMRLNLSLSRDLMDMIDMVLARLCN